MEATRKSNHAEAGFVPVVERVAAGLVISLVLFRR
jgi:hypothetical protein